ncbi:hypothetical protein MFMK1_003263 [Metallumcola ferriviriculae]|uniref:Uncharacterized protein n=1 Tax=Metallumcola ferriviriculae TaxID=3039180 RepID=A0AAU0US38_9FIRM|nr:hypothetical protein MFMK1_003263 [Desulfitibacteraceae bacterium MK1]
MSLVMPEYPHKDKQETDTACNTKWMKYRDSAKKAALILSKSMKIGELVEPKLMRKGLTVEREGFAEYACCHITIGYSVRCCPQYFTTMAIRWAKVLIQRELKRNQVDVKPIEQPNYDIFAHDRNDFLVNGMLWNCSTSINAWKLHWGWEEADAKKPSKAVMLVVLPSVIRLVISNVSKGSLTPFEISAKYPSFF